MDGAEPVTKPDARLQTGATLEKCSVWWIEADTPVQTKCGYVYCPSCFSGTSTAAMGRQLRHRFATVIKAGCRAVVGVDGLQEHLSSAVLEQSIRRILFVSCQEATRTIYCLFADHYIYRVAPKRKTTELLEQSPAQCVPLARKPHTGISRADYRRVDVGLPCGALEAEEDGGHQALLQSVRFGFEKDCR